MNDDIKKLSVDKQEILALELLKRLKGNRQSIALSSNSTIHSPMDSRTMPVSFLQQKWLLEEYPANVSRTFYLQGNLNIVALEQSFNEIIRRHETLRTTFSNLNGCFVQSISTFSPKPLPLEDLSTLPEDESYNLARQLIAERLELPFDRSREAPMRTKLFKLSAEKYILTISADHIAFDGWSAGILLKELSQLYQIFSSQSTPSLPELQIQYSDFTRWQRQYVDDQILERMSQYLEERSKRITETRLLWPTDYPRSNVDELQGIGVQQSLVLPVEVVKELEYLRNKEGTTLYVLLFSIFMALVYHYTGQTTILAQVPYANRMFPETDKIIGSFSYILGLCIQIDKDLSFLKLLSQFQEEFLNAQMSQPIPFGSIPSDILNRTEKFTKLPEKHWIFVNYLDNRGDFELLNLVVTPLQTTNMTLHTDLFFAIFRNPQEFTICITYRSDLFKRSTIHRMLQYFKSLLEIVIVNPELPISTLTKIGQSGDQL